MSDGVMVGELETPLHLYQPPLYRGGSGPWQPRYADAVASCDGELTWSPAGILSMLSHKYACADLTLLQEVVRQPWLSRIGEGGTPERMPIPPHDTLWMSYDAIATGLRQRLADEALRVCHGADEICILVTGGCDSRVVAGTVASLAREGKINARLTAMTWGMPDSRDVAYGRATAETLGIPWRHADLTPAHLEENIEEVAAKLGALVAPTHLHRMPWFKDVSPGTLVLGGSYGDSVGRAEFSKSRLLELRPMQPQNSFGLLRPEFIAPARQQLDADFAALHARTPGQPAYVLREHEMQGYYMRGLIAHAMSVINSHCRVYQMFTHPDVYSFMWSIHPTLRYDEVYVRLLGQLDERLVHLPWARTNRALRGRTMGARRDLRKEYHDYVAWITGPIHESWRDVVDPAWFGATGIFDERSVAGLCDIIRGGAMAAPLEGNLPHELWVWLASVRRFAEHIEKLGKRIVAPIVPEGSAAGPAPVPLQRAGLVRRRLRRSPLVYKIVTGVRRFILRHRARFKYPPRHGGKLTG